ncbi:MAG: hypothetical protein PHE25_05655 [Candidatus Gracilibacteria bacterium]|nr:hypothetical protein [Candidatus Gracilibacteria bacterium]
MFQNEKIIEIKVCKYCFTSFEITDKDLEFYERVSPIFEPNSNLTLSGGEPNNSFPDNGRLGGVINIGNGKVKYLIPTPTLCPECRQQRRLSFRNERKLYKRKCDATGKEIISIYSPDKPYKVYEQSYWWSDNYNSLDYGKDFDFNKSFFEQFEELMREVPRNSTFLNISGSVNSDYTNHSGNVKNCYYSFAIWSCEDCLYDNLTTNSKNCLDSNSITKCENCYYCVDCEECYNSFWCVGCEKSNNIYSSYNCKGCDFCIACNNLVNKKFCIENIPYSKEEYLSKLKKYLQKDKNHLLSNVRKKTIFQNMKIIGSENCTGGQIINSSNCNYSFDIFGNVENSKYVINGLNARYVYDAYGFGVNQDLAYEIVDTGLDSTNQYFCLVVHNTNNALYSQICFNSSNLFGCIGLRNKSYCILNKQYTKEEYEKLVPKIIEHMMITGEWGEFFPSSISPFGYNETIAEEYFPISRDKALHYLYKWSDYEPQLPKVEKIITVEMYSNTSLLEDANKVPDDILNRAIECEITKKPFRIIKQELEFYRKHNLPIPKRHPDQRHLDRMKLRNPRNLFDRVCDKCNKKIKTTYSPERPEIVYCEECYNNEIY